MANEKDWRQASSPQAMAGHRVDGDLVGDWPQGRQRAAALHHYAGIRLFDEGQSDFIAQGVGGVGTAAALQVDQGMGERNVVFADELVVVDDVLLERGPVLGEVVGRSGPSGEDAIHKVRGAAHHAATGPRPPGHHFLLPLQVINGLWDHEREPYGFARGGRGESHLLAKRRVVLHVVESRHRPRAVTQRRMGGHVLDALTVDPHLPGAFPEACDVFLSSAGRHCFHLSVRD